MLREGCTGERAGAWSGVGDLCSHFSLCFFMRIFFAYDFECAPRKQVLLPSSILLARKSLSNPSLCFCSSFFV